jgi:hypothetical protein
VEIDMPDYPPVPFQTAASDLRDFYILAGTASATLVGLLFVGLSLHLRVVVSVSEVRSLARVTLANFGVVLFVTLFLVINENQSTAALQLVISGVVSLVITIPSLIAARSEGHTLEMRRLDRARLVLRFGLSSLSYLAIICAGILLFSSMVTVFVPVLVTAIMVLLVVSLRNTWDLLVTVGDVTLGGDSQK